MFRTVVVAAALAFSLAGCTTDTTPAPAAPPVVAPAPEGQNTTGTSSTEELRRITEDIERQQQANMERVQEQMREMDMPAPPSLMPGDAGYEAEMQRYNDEINRFMCEQGNAYTIPENQRSC